MIPVLFLVFACAAPVLASGEREEVPGLEFSHSMELSYAEEFSVDYYKGGYKLLTIREEGKFLVVPEEGAVPEGLDPDIAVLQQPLDHIYLVATSAMDLFRAVGGIENIRLSGTKEDGWYIQEAKDALASGEMLYAGKYNAPDYELILSEGCDLAVESTMIHHTPEVKEKLEQFGIPVLVERSSYESHPLGRTEWIRLYGAVLNREEEADRVFREQAEKLEKIASEKNTGKTVAFFYINSVGAVNVRKSNDYVSKMIELAGGVYVPEDTGADDSAPPRTMTARIRGRRISQIMLQDTSSPFPRKTMSKISETERSILPEFTFHTNKTARRTVSIINADTYLPTRFFSAILHSPLILFCTAILFCAYK